MARSGTAPASSGVVLCCTLLWLAAGCVSTPPPEIPIDSIASSIPERRIIPDRPAPVVLPPPVELAPPPPPDVAIVLSSRLPVYEAVATAIGERYANARIYDLSDKSQPPVTAFRIINDAGPDAVVAVGLRAAQSASSLADAPVIICQVFNFMDANLVDDNTRIVSALPPLDLQVAAWKKLHPSLQRIGAIVGPGHEDLIAEAQAAGRAHDIDVQIRHASSDREALYIFSRMSRDLDGFWLFPDNRILSTTVLQELLEQAARRRVQVTVFNDGLLKLGAALSATTIESDIADTVVSVVDNIVAGNFSDVPPVLPLSDVRIVTNEALLKRFMQAASKAANASGR